MAFIAMFSYMYPIALKILPVDTGIILHFVSLGYFLIAKPFKLNRKYAYCFLCGIILITWDICTTLLFNNIYEFSVIKKNISAFLYIFSAILVVDCIKKTTKNYSAYTVLEWIVYVCVIQAAVSLVLFSNPNLTEWFLSQIKFHDEISSSIILTQSTFRLISISKTQYANMAVMYGFALLCMICLAFSNKSFFFQKYKSLFFCAVILIIIAGILSARTFFLLIVLCFFYLSYILYKKHKLILLLRFYLIIGIIISFIPIVNLLLENNEYTRTIKWAFEFFLSQGEGEGVRTDSTDVLFTMYYLPKRLKTCIIGDGKFLLGDGGFYGGSDVGYIRNLFYGGIVGVFLFYTMQIIYYKIICSTTQYYAIKILCAFFLLWVFFYNFKEYWSANIYWILLLVANVAEQKYPPEYHNIPSTA